jgi:hypothetical protein
MQESPKAQKKPIHELIDESLAIQVKRIISKTLAEFGNNKNLSYHFITCQELQGIIQSFTTELMHQIKELQWGTSPRKVAAKWWWMSPDSPGTFDYGTLDTPIMCEDNGNDAHARGPFWLYLIYLDNSSIEGKGRQMGNNQWMQTNMGTIPHMLSGCTSPLDTSV